MTDPVRPSPKPPDDKAALAHELTPSDFPATRRFVKNELAARDVDRGRPVLSKTLTPWFFAAFTLCGSVTTVAMSFEGVLPKGVLVAAAVGTMFFGGMLGIGPGLRK